MNNNLTKKHDRPPPVRECSTKRHLVLGNNKNLVFIPNKNLVFIANENLVFVCDISFTNLKPHDV